MFFFFFNDTATTEIYTLSLHDALPISCRRRGSETRRVGRPPPRRRVPHPVPGGSSAHPQTGRTPEAGTPGVIAGPAVRSEEHTSELQSQSNLVCRLLLEKKKNYITEQR